MGTEADREISSEMGIYPDASLANTVTDMGKHLAAGSERPDLPWSFKIVDEPVVNAWLGYDLRWGAKYGVRFPNASGYEDPLVNSPLINELHDRHGLDFVLKRAGFPGKDMTALHEAARQYKVKIPDVRKTLWKFHAGDVAAYNIADVADMFPLIDYQHKIIEEQDLTEVWELEKKVLPDDELERLLEPRHQTEP